MKFHLNINKYKVTNYHLLKNPITSKHYFANCFKDLGVLFDPKLSFKYYTLTIDS